MRIKVQKINEENDSLRALNIFRANQYRFYSLGVLTLASIKACTASEQKNLIVASQVVIMGSSKVPCPPFFLLLP